jgi:YD repeat-containing protein
MSPRTQTTLVAALLAILATEASAQQRTFYDSSGRVTGRSSTDSQGSNYDARGKVISRETTTGNQTTVYDARGRNVGTFTTNR